MKYSIYIKQEVCSINSFYLWYIEIYTYVYVYMTEILQNIEIMIKINSYIFIVGKIKILDNKLLSIFIMLKVF